MNQQTYPLELPFFSNKDYEKIVPKLWNEQYPEMPGVFDFLSNSEQILEGDYHFLKMGKESNMLYITIYSLKELQNPKVKRDEVRIEFSEDTDYDWCILEGDSETTVRTKQFVENIGKKPMELIGLYKNPENIKFLKIHNPKFLIIDTTYFDSENVDKLMIAIEKLGYIPEKIFYLNQIITTKYPYEEIFSVNNFKYK